VRRLGHEAVYPNGNGGAIRDVDAAVIEPGDFAGLRHAREVRERGCPVVFTSIFPAEAEALALEPAAYFIKPFALHELARVLATALAPEQTP